MEDALELSASRRPAHWDGARHSRSLPVLPGQQSVSLSTLPVDKASIETEIGSSIDKLGVSNYTSWEDELLGERRSASFSLALLLTGHGAHWLSIILHWLILVGAGASIALRCENVIDIITQNHDPNLDGTPEVKKDISSKVSELLSEIMLIIRSGLMGVAFWHSRSASINWTKCQPYWFKLTAYTSSLGLMVCRLLWMFFGQIECDSKRDVRHSFQEIAEVLFLATSAMLLCILASWCALASEDVRLFGKSLKQMPAGATGSLAEQRDSYRQAICRHYRLRGSCKKLSRILEYPMKFTAVAYLFWTLSIALDVGSGMSSNIAKKPQCILIPFAIGSSPVCLTLFLLWMLTGINESLNEGRSAVRIMLSQLDSESGAAGLPALVGLRMVLDTDPVGWFITKEKPLQRSLFMALFVTVGARVSIELCMAVLEVK